MNADEVINTVRGTSGVIRESSEFLSKLYNAEKNNLWYKPIETDEIYTTLKPDYRQTLKKRYGEKLKEIRQVNSQLQEARSERVGIERELSNAVDLDSRTPLIEKKVA